MTRQVISCYFIGFYILFVIIGCDKINKVCDFKGSHKFELKLQLQPVLDTFRVGDTISIVSEFSNYIYDRSTQNSYVLHDFKFYPTIEIGRLDTNEVFASLEWFDFIVDPKYEFVERLYSDGESRILAEYLYDGEMYSLKYIIIPLEKGLYLFNMPSLLYPGGEDQDFPGRCKGKTSEAAVDLNGGGENNFSFIYHSPDSVFVERITRQRQHKFDDSGGYCFYVVE